MRRSAALLAIAALATASHADELTLPQPEAISLLGRELDPPELDPGFRAEQERLLENAVARRDARPRDPDAWIWVGRRQAYLGEYRAAILTYSEAIARFPEDPRLYRHRGHRRITIRELDRAVEDLERGVELAREKPDEVEPDGLPNARGIPTSTLKTNLWYHLGLAHYLRGDFGAAAAAYADCLAAADNPDMTVAASHWAYMTLRRLGRDAEAARLLEPVHAKLDVIENGGYHRLLLAYKGELDPEDLLREAAQDRGAVAYPTTAYGVAAWHLYDGRPDEAHRIFGEILESSGWAAFGYLAAEAEIARRSED